MLRVVLDTNIWISFMIGKELKGLEKYLNKKVKIITSSEQIEELVSVLRREKFKKYFLKDDIKELLFLIMKVSEIVNINHNIYDCRDEKDNFILEMAINGKVDIIVTGDNDLLILHPYKNISIINYKEFEKIMKRLK
jgi:putative PIN family toxin of toxin-antitoxin system